MPEEARGTQHHSILPFNKSLYQILNITSNLYLLFQGYMKLDTSVINVLCPNKFESVDLKTVPGLVRPLSG